MIITKHIRNLEWFPNYFGSQRFGRNNNNIKIGKLILKRKFKEAVKAIAEDNQRQKEYLEYHLKQKPGDYIEIILVL